MNFFAKVNLSGEENGGDVLRAFFEEFNPTNSLVIENNEVKIEFQFESNTVPMKLIAAIGSCRNFDFKYEGDSQLLELKNGDDTSNQNEEIPTKEQYERELLAESKSDNFNPEEIEEGNCSEEEVHTIVPELEEIAQKSSSYEDFIRFVAKWINFKKREQLFICLVKSAVEIANATSTEKISWTELESKVTFNMSDRNLMSKQVSESFKESKKPLKLIELFKEIVYYQNYDFPEENADVVEEFTSDEVPELKAIAQKTSSYEKFVISVAKWIKFGKRNPLFINLVKAAEEIAKETFVEKITWALLADKVDITLSDKQLMSRKIKEAFKDSENPLKMLELIKKIISYQNYSFSADNADEPKNVASKVILKMECIDHVDHFGQILQNIDWNQSVEERVKFVLTEMGWPETADENQDRILNMAIAAVKDENFSFEDFITDDEREKYGPEYGLLLFSSFVNQYVHRNGNHIMVSAREFLPELRQILNNKSQSIPDVLNT